MADVQRKTIEIRGSLLTYDLVIASRFDVVRLRTGLAHAASDFNHFRHTSNPDTRTVIAVADVMLKDIELPNFMRGSRNRRTRFLNLRPLVSYWAADYLAAKGSGSTAWAASHVELSELLTAFGMLIDRGLIAISEPEPSTVQQELEPVIVGTLGYLSGAALARVGSVVSASGYSIVNFEECVAPFQAIRDPIGFRAQGGTVTSMAAYNRPAMLQTTSGCRMCNLDYSDIAISLFGGEVRFGTGADLGSAVKVFTTNPKLRSTPTGIERVEVIVVENRAIAICRGGGVPIPYSGFILSGDTSTFGPAFLAELDQNSIVDLTIANVPGLVAGIQCGPTLVRSGCPVDLESTFIEEGFVAYGAESTPAPTALHRSMGNVRAARTAIGLRTDGSVVVLVSEGTNTSASRDRPGEAFGATFGEMMAIANAEGLHDAMALDSGGSVGLYSQGTPVIQSGDMRDHTNKRFERPLAHGLVFD